jgi:amino acid transporter
MPDAGEEDAPPAHLRRGGLVRSGWRFLVGEPLRFAEAVREQITPVEGLSALSLDALTSVAYGPEAILVVLASAGAGALHVALPVTVAIVVLLALLVFSYRQVIVAYPGGGGAYAVSRANFGRGASQLAAASLIVDYTLTVAVSIAAGVGALTSAYPGFTQYTVPICLGILALVTVLNLRGLGEGARAFLLPTMLFIVGLLGVIAVGLIHPLAPHLRQSGQSLLPARATEAVGILLVLKAFAAGCSALTGVEAIANGVPLFKEPRVKRAKRTEMLLGVLLGVMLLGLGVLAQRFHVGPRTGQTVLSQIMAYSVGRSWAYYVVSLAITAVLALAANTSFGGLPVLASLLARDNYLPHVFALRGDRLVFTSGIWTLSIMSGALLIAVEGNTNELIPLFAIGVFIGFTLAQSGLVVHWWRVRTPGWRGRAALNGLGAVVTGLSTVVFLVAKFVEGAWLVVVAVPLFILLFHRIHAYYHRVGEQVGLGRIPSRPERRRTLAIVPVANISRLTEQALSEAMSISDEVMAVTVELNEPVAEDDLTHHRHDPEEDHQTHLVRRAVERAAAGARAAGARAGGHAGGAGSGRSRAHSTRPLTVGGGARTEELRRQWEEWAPGVTLEVLTTEYASIVAPIVELIDKLREERDEQIVVLIPVLAPARIRYRVLHNQLDIALATALRSRTDVVVARVPLRVGDSEDVEVGVPVPPDDQLHLPDDR